MLLLCFLPAQAIGTGFDHFIVGAFGDSARVVYPAIVPLESKGAALAWNVSLYGMGGTGGRLPFWSVTNRRGLFPQSLGLSASGSRDGGRFGRRAFSCRVWRSGRLERHGGQDVFRTGMEKASS